MLWSLDSAGRPERYALLTGSSSIYHSMRCAVAVAECLAKDRPDWELAAGRLGHAVAHHPGAFAPKVEFAMDWYYPMLSGALEGEPGRRRIAEGWSTFVMEGLGVRCVSTGDWVTAAETAECVLTLDALGMDGPAMDLFAAGQNLRLPDGSYWTGMVFPDRETFPKDERTTYTFAAMVLAADALSTPVRPPACSGAKACRPRSTWPSRTAATPSRVAPWPIRRSTSPAAERRSDAVAADPGSIAARVDSIPIPMPPRRPRHASCLTLTAAEDPRVTRRRRLTLVAMCIAQGMTLLDVTIVNTALPSIQRELHMTAGQLEWVISAYALSAWPPSSPSVARWETASDASGSSWRAWSSSRSARSPAPSRPRTWRSSDPGPSRGRAAPSCRP